MKENECVFSSSKHVSKGMVEMALWVSVGGYDVVSMLVQLY